MGVTGTGALVRIKALESDERLARAAAGGSDAGFATLHQRHRDGLYRTALSVTCDSDEALSAFQEATLDALRELRRDGPPEHVRGWLHAIARHATFEVVRERRPGALDDAVPAKTGVLETVLARDHVHLLMDDVSALSRDQRTALVLRELEGLSYDELGVTMATTPATVRQSVHQARLALGDRAAGRELACDAVRDTLETGGGRSARGRKVRGHLDVCPSCRVFANGLRDRRAALGLLFPLVPAEAGQAALARALAGGTGVSAGAGAGVRGAQGTGTTASAGGVARPAWKGLLVGGVAAAAAVAGALAVGLSDSGPEGESTQVANGAPGVTAPGTSPPASGMGGDSELFGDDLFGDGASGDRDDGDDRDGDARPTEELFASTGGPDGSGPSGGSGPSDGQGPSGGSGPSDGQGPSDGPGPSGGGTPVAPASPAPAPSPASAPAPPPAPAAPAPEPAGGPVSGLAGGVDDLTGGALNVEPTLAPVTDPLGL